MTDVTDSGVEHYRDRGSFDEVRFGSHCVDCYPANCTYRVYVRDGKIVREEIAGPIDPPPPSDVPDDLPLVQADPGLLERVIANLVTNALTASPSDRTVLIRGFATGQQLQLRIVDHGPGIPAADRDRMFVPFQNRDDHTAEAGLGLGLAIAHGFTRAMNGTLTPSDTPGGGLTVTITLPPAP